MPRLIVTKILIEILSVPAISHHYFSIIDSIIPCIWRCYFTCGCRGVLILLIRAYVMLTLRSRIEVILRILLFEVLYLLVNLLGIFSISLMYHALRLIMPLH